MSSFGANLAKIRNNANLSREALGDLLGVSKDKIKHVETGHQRADHELLMQYRLLLGADINAILVDASEGPTVPLRPVANNATPDSFVSIPRYDVEASAGQGRGLDLELETSAYAFKKAWLDRRGLNSNDLSIISVTGNSMEPDLFDGDLVLLDHASTELVDSSIYVVRFSTALYVKRIQHQPGDKVLLISKNKDYPPIEITNPVADGVEVIGRIVASMHEW